MKHKNWVVALDLNKEGTRVDDDTIIDALLTNRGLVSPSEKKDFLVPPKPLDLSFHDVGIDESALIIGVDRIIKAIQDKKSIVVYADYDADGITAGAIMWEAVFALGGNIMPYIPHRADEGYGLSQKGIDSVRDQYHPTLIITVDHGVTAHEKVAYAKNLGIDVIVTDHHVKPEIVPDCPMIHTTTLCGSGISWFVVSCIVKKMHAEDKVNLDDLLSLAAIGTIADMVPLVGPNRTIAKYGLAALNVSKRVGIIELLKGAGVSLGELGTYDISHVLAPRLNAMGRLVHAMDALRLICTKDPLKAVSLALTVGDTNKERQQLTVDTTLHATEIVKGGELKKLLFVSHETYNQGIIGLVAGKLVETYYRPSVVIARGDLISKASARSISGFNIVEAIRMCSDLLIDVGGHPMAAGFTVETKNLDALQERLEIYADKVIEDSLLVRSIKIDVAIPFASVTEALWHSMRDFEPFGLGNPEPVFMTPQVEIADMRLVGNDGKHLKLRIKDPQSSQIIDAIAFSMGKRYGELKQGAVIDIVYTIDMNVWNGNKKIQVKVRDMKIN